MSNISELHSNIAEMKKRNAEKERGWRDEEDSRQEKAAAEEAHLKRALAEAEDEERKLAEAGYREDDVNKEEDLKGGKTVFRRCWEPG